MTNANITGIDYSFTQPDFSSVKAKGFSFALSYFSKTDAKDWQLNEMQAALAAGLQVGAVYETSANEAANGFNAGVADANDAVRQAAEVGYTGVLYFAVDFNATGTNLDKVVDYFRGISSVISPTRVGVYGSYHVVGSVYSAGYARWIWQASAWSANQFDSRAVIYQNANKASGITGSDWDLGDLEMGLMRPGASPVPTPPPAPVPTPSVAPAFPGNISRGSKNTPAVELIQAKLGVSIDGVFGPNTESAVKNFQKTHQLEEDGIVGKNTWAALFTGIPAPTPAPSTPFPLSSGYYGLGSHTGTNATDKSNIKLIQKKVGTSADGVFGKNTAASVKTFQKNHGLTQDGKVGPDTWKKLFG